MQVRTIHTIIALLLVSVIGLSSCKPFKARKAVELNNAVIVEQGKLMNALIDYYDALNARDKERIAQTLAILQERAESGIGQLEELESPGCGTDFLEAAGDLFRFYSEAAEAEYNKMAEYYLQDSLSYEGYDSLQVLEKAIEREREAADRSFLNAQRSFAQTCGFKLIRNAD